MQNRETRILQRVCENANEYGEREREGGEEERERRRTMCSKLASPLDRRTCERKGGQGTATNDFDFY